jgi:biopolymer transport protein ExbD
VSRTTRSRNPEGIHEPNMVPLIDVSLVLVVILLVATPMALQSGIAVSRAAPSGSKAAAAKTERIELSILGPDEIVVNRIPVSSATLGPVLGPLLASSPTRQVVVSCAEGVPHGAFVRVLDEARAQGAAQIAVMSR